MCHKHCLRKSAFYPLFLPLDYEQLQVLFWESLLSVMSQRAVIPQRGPFKVNDNTSSQMLKQSKSCLFSMEIIR